VFEFGELKSWGVVGRLSGRIFGEEESMARDAGIVL
jgi:hypothetical protein